MLGLEQLAVMFVDRNLTLKRDEISLVEWAIRSRNTTHQLLLRELRDTCNNAKLRALVDEHPVLGSRQLADSVGVCAADNLEEIVRLAANALRLYAFIELGRRQEAEANRRANLPLWRAVLEELADIWQAIRHRRRL